MEWTNIVLGFNFLLLLQVFIALTTPVEHKPDQIQATYTANVAHGSLVNEDHNAVSAINGTVGAQLSTIKGCSLEQLFQRIGEVLSKMVANAGGSIVPSIHDDIGRNRVEFNISVTAEQHNNVSSLRTRPKDERTPGTQREATDYPTSLDDDSREKRSPATFRRPRHQPERAQPDLELSPSVKSAKNWPNFGEGSLESLAHHQPLKFNVSQTEEKDFNKERSSDLPTNHSNQLDFDVFRPTETGNKLPVPFLQKPGNEVLVGFDKGQLSDEKSEYQEESLDELPQPIGVLENAYAKLPETGKLQESSLEKGKQHKTDLFPIIPYSDFPHVHNGDNSAELLNEGTPTMPVAQRYAVDSERGYDQPNTNKNAPVMTGLPKLLNRGLIPLDRPSKDNHERHSDLSQAYSSGRRYGGKSIDMKSSDVIEESKRPPSRALPFDRPQRYLITEDTLPGNGPEMPQTLNLNSGRAFDLVGLRPQTTKPTSDNNAPVVMPQGVSAGDSNIMYMQNYMPIAPPTSKTGGQDEYPEKAPIYPVETQDFPNPSTGTMPSYSLHNPADIEDTFKQDLTDTVNDIGSNYNDGVRNNAFINHAEEDPYFPEVGETRKQAVPGASSFLTLQKLLKSNLSSSRPAQAPAAPHEDIAPAETLPLEGEQPFLLSESAIKTPTGNAEASKKFGTEPLSSFQL